MAAWTNVWHLETYRDRARRFKMFSKPMMKKLQSAKNKGLQTILGKNNQRTPTNTYLELADDLNVHQMNFEAIATLKKRIVLSGESQVLGELFAP